MPKPPQPRARKILSAKTTAVGLLLILILISWAMMQNLSKQKVVDKESQKLAQEIQNLEEQNIELTDLIEYFATQEFIEKEAREKLNLAKPGEKVVIVPEEGESGEVVSEEVEKRGSIKNAPLKWWRYFFSNCD